MKTYNDCKKEVAAKYGFGDLVMGHKVKYFDEAAEMYAAQYKELLLDNIPDMDTGAEGEKS